MQNSNNSKGLRRFIWQVCAFGFFNECVFIYSWYAVMFADHGLSAAQISILFAVWSTTAFILEIPSGALADKYSRRHILAFAQIARICGYTVWVLCPTFWGFLIGFICWGVKSAFCSGTFEALIYDELKHFGDEQDYAKILGRMNVCSNVGVMIAAAAAVPMIRLGYRAVILASLVPLALSSVAALTMRPAKQIESTRELNYLHLLRDGVAEAARNPIVLRLILFLSIALSFGALDEYFTLFSKAAGLPKPAIGAVWAVTMAVYTLGHAVAYRFTHLPRIVFYVGYLLAGVLLCIGTYFICPLSIASILVLVLVFAVTGVAMEASLQHAISGHARATVTSVLGFAANVACVALYLVFGAIARSSDYRGGFLFCGVAMVLIGTAYVLSERRRSCAKPAATRIEQEVET